MKHERSIIAGMTDYTAVSLEDILGDLCNWKKNTEELVHFLENLKSTVISLGSRLENSQEKISFIEYFQGVFSKYAKEFDRLEKNMHGGVRQEHVDALEAIYNSIKENETICLDFKREHINTRIADNSIRYSVVDPIYGKTRDMLVDYKDISNVIPRLTLLINDIRDAPTSSRSDHPGWRLAVMIIVISVAFLAFWLLPLFAAISLSVFMVVVFPLAAAAISHKGLEGKDFVSMYAKGLHALSSIGSIFKVLSGK